MIISFPVQIVAKSPRERVPISDDMGVQESDAGSYAAPRKPFHTIMVEPVHATASFPNSPKGDGVMGLQTLRTGSYAAPSSAEGFSAVLPPQMIISDPVQTDANRHRGEGAPTCDTGVQESWIGS